LINFILKLKKNQQFCSFETSNKRTQTFG